MNQKLIITKAYGDKEAFSAAKLRRSMSDSGASKKTIESIIKKIKTHIKPEATTSQIHHLAFQMLKRSNKAYAARYNLKKAIMALGPDGFPFERYFAALLAHFDYKVQTNVIVNGRCITHEVDIIAEKHKENIHAIIEAKFHGHPGRKTGSKDALYTHGRFLDIQNEWKDKKKGGAKPKQGKLQSWLVTNTEMTSNSISYCNCVGIKAIAWSYPEDETNLQSMVHTTGLYPITALVTLNKKDKKRLLRNNVMMCKDLINNKKALRRAGLTDRQADNVLAEVTELCGDTI